MDPQSLYNHTGYTSQTLRHHKRQSAHVGGGLLVPSEGSAPEAVIVKITSRIRIRRIFFPEEIVKTIVIVVRMESLEFIVVQDNNAGDVVTATWLR